MRIIQFIHSTENLIKQVEGSLLVQCSMQKHERFFYKLCNFYETENPNFFCENINEMFTMLSSCLIIVQNIIFCTVSWWVRILNRIEEVPQVHFSIQLKFKVEFFDWRWKLNASLIFNWDWFIGKFNNSINLLFNSISKCKDCAKETPK